MSLCLQRLISKEQGQIYLLPHMFKPNWQSSNKTVGLRTLLLCIQVVHLRLCFCHAFANIFLVIMFGVCLLPCCFHYSVPCTCSRRSEQKCSSPLWYSEREKENRRRYSSDCVKINLRPTQIPIKWVTDPFLLGGRMAGT